MINVNQIRKLRHYAGVSLGGGAVLALMAGLGFVASNNLTDLYNVPREESAEQLAQKVETTATLQQDVRARWESLSIHNPFQDLEGIALADAYCTDPQSFGQSKSDPTLCSNVDEVFRAAYQENQARIQYGELAKQGTMDKVRSGLRVINAVGFALGVTMVLAGGSVLLSFNYERFGFRPPPSDSKQ